MRNITLKNIESINFTSRFHKRHVLAMFCWLRTTNFFDFVATWSYLGLENLISTLEVVKIPLYATFYCWVPVYLGFWPSDECTDLLDSFFQLQPLFLWKINIQPVFHLFPRGDVTPIVSDSPTWYTSSWLAIAPRPLAKKFTFFKRNLRLFPLTADFQLREVVFYAEESMKLIFEKCTNSKSQFGFNFWGKFD